MAIGRGLLGLLKTVSLGAGETGRPPDIDAVSYNELLQALNINVQIDGIAVAMVRIGVDDAGSAFQLQSVLQTCFLLFFRQPDRFHVGLLVEKELIGLIVVACGRKKSERV